MDRYVRQVTVGRAMRWWPPVGVLGMLALGWVVGRHSTPIDDRFARDAQVVVGKHPSWLLVVTDWWLLAPVLAGCVAVALYRRQWRLAAVIVGWWCW
jgi:hypothetical protein